MKRIFCTILALSALTLGSVDELQAQVNEFSQFGITTGSGALSLNPAYQPGGRHGFINVLSVEAGAILPDSYNNLAQKGKDGKDIILTEDLLHSLGQHPITGLLRTQIGAGFRTKIGYFNFELKVNANTGGYISSDLARLISEGNHHLAGQDQVDLGGFNLNTQLYSELNLGFSKSFLDEDRLTIGARAKFLVGHAVMKLLKSDFVYSTTPNNDRIEIESHQKLGISSAFFEYTKDQNGKVDLNGIKLKQPQSADDLMPQNFGFGIDLGAVYKLSDKLTISGAITDLGYIRWQDNINVLESNLTGDQKLVYRGVNLNSKTKNNNGTTNQNGEQKDELKELEDQLLNSFKEVDGDSFTTGLSTRMHIAAEYDPMKWLKLSGAVGSDIYMDNMNPWMTVIGTIHRGDQLALSMGINAMRHAPIGVSAAFRLGPLVVSADNILAVHYLSARRANLKAGLIFNI